MRAREALLEIEAQRGVDADAQPGPLRRAEHAVVGAGRKARGLLAGPEG